jgi:hypothetical protein
VPQRARETVLVFKVDIGGRALLSRDAPSFLQLDFLVCFSHLTTTEDELALIGIMLGARQPKPLINCEFSRVMTV